jgi:hypothetical protein
LVQLVDSARRILLVAAATALLPACGGYVARGRHLYNEGRYIESADVLARHEDDSRGEPPRRQAEYATYRGLSMLVLGDYPEAHRWMQFAYSIENKYPGSLRPDFRRDLDHGWMQLQPRLRPMPPPGGAAQGPMPQ